ncbi:MAG: hypothetical protein FJ399_19900 [Verrucomicrobia bacterium]|nr:hypothetical protein [Verrucomicrobiota bacterium]
MAKAQPSPRNPDRFRRGLPAAAIRHCARQEFQAVAGDGIVAPAGVHRWMVYQHCGGTNALCEAASGVG